jgi:DNA-binding LytR/AlgR family response regulator
MNSNSPLTAVVADDEANLRERLVELLAQCWPELKVVSQASNGIEALEQIEKFEPTVVFLDIKMPGKTGLQVAQELVQLSAAQRPRIVFATAFDQFAVQAFESEAVDYLLKPIELARLEATVVRLKRSIQESALSQLPNIAKVLSLLAGTPSQTIVDSAGASGSLIEGEGAANTGNETSRKHLRWIRASQGDTTYHLDVNQVLFFKSDDKYTVVQATQGEYVIRKTLAELLAELDPDQFWQIHRGTIVNASYLTVTRRDVLGNVTVHLRGFAEGLVVAKPYQQKFKHM